MKWRLTLISLPSFKGDRGWVRLGLAGLAGVALFAGIAAAPSQEDWSVQQWIDWRDREIGEILTPKLAVNGEQVLVRDDVQARCAEDAKLLDKAPKELANFAAFVKAQALMADKEHALGFEVTDQQYAKEATAVAELPPLLQSQAFLDLMRTPKGYRDAVAMIEDHNRELPEDRRWIVLPYKAQFIKSVDKTTYGRLLVIVPGPDVDKWIQFAIATPEMTDPPEIRSVSVVAVRKPAGGRTETYFIDFMRQRSGGDIDLVPTVALPAKPNDNCYNCHKSGVAPIHPAESYGFDASGSLVPRESLLPDKINKRIRDYGRTEVKRLNQAAYGPCLGPDRARSLDELRAATKGMDLSDASLGRVRDAMACGKCHQDFAPINYPQSVRTQGDLTAFQNHVGLGQTYVEKGWMPPGNTLSPEERKALWKCLMQDYFDPVRRDGVLVRWLRGAPRF